jgi:hypothetical protein
MPRRQAGETGQQISFNDVAEAVLGTKKEERPLGGRIPAKSAQVSMEPPIGKPDPTPLLLASERTPQDIRSILSAYMSGINSSAFCRS